MWSQSEHYPWGQSNRLSSTKNPLATTSPPRFSARQGPIHAERKAWGQSPASVSVSPSTSSDLVSLEQAGKTVALTCLGRHHPVLVLLCSAFRDHGTSHLVYCMEGIPTRSVGVGRRQPIHLTWPRPRCPAGSFRLASCRMSYAGYSISPSSVAPKSRGRSGTRLI